MAWFLVQRVDKPRAATWLCGTPASVAARLQAEGGVWEVLATRDEIHGSTL